MPVRGSCLEPEADAGPSPATRSGVVVVELGDVLICGVVVVVDGVVGVDCDVPLDCDVPVCFLAADFFFGTVVPPSGSWYWSSPAPPAREPRRGCRGARRWSGTRGSGGELPSRGDDRGKIGPAVRSASAPNCGTFARGCAPPRTTSGATHHATQGTGPPSRAGALRGPSPLVPDDEPDDPPGRSHARGDRRRPGRAGPARRRPPRGARRPPRAHRPAAAADGSHAHPAGPRRRVRHGPGGRTRRRDPDQQRPAAGVHHPGDAVARLDRLRRAGRADLRVPDPPRRRAGRPDGRRPRRRPRQAGRAGDLHHTVRRGPGRSCSSRWPSACSERSSASRSPR